jgi:hypothetical protein
MPQESRAAKLEKAGMAPLFISLAYLRKRATGGRTWEPFRAVTAKLTHSEHIGRQRPSPDREQNDRQPAFERRRGINWGLPV